MEYNVLGTAVVVIFSDVLSNQQEEIWVVVGWWPMTCWSNQCIRFWVNKRVPYLYTDKSRHNKVGIKVAVRPFFYWLMVQCGIAVHAVSYLLLTRITVYSFVDFNMHNMFTLLLCQVSIPL